MVIILKVLDRKGMVYLKQGDNMNKIIRSRLLSVKELRTIPIEDQIKYYEVIQ